MNDSTNSFHLIALLSRTILADWASSGQYYHRSSNARRKSTMICFRWGFILIISTLVFTSYVMEMVIGTIATEIAFRISGSLLSENVLNLKTSIGRSASYALQLDTAHLFSGGMTKHKMLSNCN